MAFFSKKRHNFWKRTILLKNFQKIETLCKDLDCPTGKAAFGRCATSNRNADTGECEGSVDDLAETIDVTHKGKINLFYNTFIFTYFLTIYITLFRKNMLFVAMCCNSTTTVDDSKCGWIYGGKSH